jgi:hypothetical protein
VWIKLKLVGEEVNGFGVMKDEELKLTEIEDSHTLGGFERVDSTLLSKMSIEVGRSVCLFATGLKKAKVEGKQCHAKTMKSMRRYSSEEEETEDLFFVFPPLFFCFPLCFPPPARRPHLRPSSKEDRRRKSEQCTGKRQKTEPG